MLTAFDAGEKGSSSLERDSWKPHVTVEGARGEQRAATGGQVKARAWECGIQVGRAGKVQAQRPLVSLIITEEKSVGLFSYLS